MKKPSNHRLIIFALGVIFIVSAFLMGMFSLKTLDNYSGSAYCETLPEGVHIPININTADAETLCLLEGIGEANAEKIIAYRKAYGDFKSAKDIMKIKGISEKTYEKIIAYITV